MAANMIYTFKAPLHTFYLYKIVIIINKENLKDFLKCY